MTRQEKLLRQAVQEERLERRADRLLSQAGFDVKGSVQSPKAMSGLKDLAALEEAGHRIGF